MQATIDTASLQGMLAGGDPVTVLDIGPDADRARWFIPGSIHVSIDRYHDLLSRGAAALTGIDLGIGRPVVTVCAAGNTSLVAARRLQADGIDALSLEGGMKAWSLAWNLAEVPLPGRPGNAADGFSVLQVRRTGKGCLSYLAAKEGDAVAIDPSLRSRVYQDLAAERGWRITAIIETHLHADHLSRAPELSEKTGAAHLFPSHRKVAFPYRSFEDGRRLPASPLVLIALHTPGHTSESTTFALGEDALFTGDTLFLEGVGRPDLEGGTTEGGTTEAREHARSLHRSLRRLASLDGDPLVLPAHTSRPVPFDRRPLAARLGGISRLVELASLSEDRFVEWIMARIPPAPPNHARIAELNLRGARFEGDPTDLEAGANRCAVLSS